MKKNDFSSFSKEIDFSKLIVNAEEKAKKQQDEFSVILVNVIKKLDATGWTLPPEMAIYPIKILGSTNEIKDIDKFFCEYFTRNEEEHFKSLTTNILNSCIEEKYKIAIRECIFAYENDKFIIASITLLTVIEGILSNFEPDKSNIRMIKVCQQQVDNLTEKDFIKREMWVSYKNFITKLYAKSDFNSDEPSSINRHWLLHGRSKYNLSKVDCLKLFNAVSTIASIVNSDSVTSK